MSVSVACVRCVLTRSPWRKENQRFLATCLIAWLMATAPAVAQIANSPFVCSCSKGSAGAFCAACRAALRDDCFCDTTSEPAHTPPKNISMCGQPTRPKAVDSTKAAQVIASVKAEISAIQGSFLGYETKLKAATTAVQEFEANKKECKATLAALESLTESDMKVAKASLDKIQQISDCTLFSLRSEVEELKRQNLTSARIGQQLTEVNDLMTNIEPFKYRLIDAETRSNTLLPQMRAVQSQCKQ